MDVLTIMVVVAVMVVIVLFIMYIIASGRERGQRPHYEKEVYMYFDPSTTPQNSALANGATIAKQDQIQEYTAAGGKASGYGYVYDGTYVIQTPEASEKPAIYGVWLYGPKPRPGSSKARPFNSKYWFQPASRV